MTDLFADQGNPQSDPNKNYLEELVGEGKKFKTAEDLARGKFEADRFIEFKNNEFDRLREDYLKLRDDNVSKQGLQELLDQFKKQTANSENTQANESQMQQPQYDPKQVESMFDLKFDAKFQQREIERKQQENYNLVKAKLTERYGNNHADVLKQQMEEMDLTPDEVNDIARNKPKLFFKALGLDEQRTDPFQAPPRSRVETTRFAPSKEKRSWSFYEKMRVEDPKRYLNPKTQTQMQQDVFTLGDEFEDGNYKAL